MSEPYDKGDTIRLFAIFRDKTQAATDSVGIAEKAATGVDPGKLRNPTTTVLKTLDPAMTITTRTLTNPGTWTHPPTRYVSTETSMTDAGYFEFLLSLTGADAQSGEWQFWFQGTGVVPTVSEGHFSVRITKFP